MLKRLRPHILIAKVGGVSTAIFRGNPILEEIAGSKLKKVQKLHLLVFRPINKTPKIFIFDMNNCLIDDKAFQLKYYYTIVETSKELFLEKDRERFITSINRYGKDGCLSNEYNGFFPQDGALCNFDVDPQGRPVVHELRFPNGSLITDQKIIKEFVQRRSPVPFMGQHDQTSVFWLLARRGVDEQTFRKISSSAYQETIANEELLVPGFNSLLGDFFGRFNHKKSLMMIATDNSAEVATATLEQMGMSEEMEEVYSRVDKIHNYPNVIRHLVDKYHVDPSEIAVFGDSYWSDIRPVLRSEFKQVITVHITGGKGYFEEYNQHGEPSIAASTLDIAFKYMLETIPERKVRVFMHWPPIPQV